MGNNQKQNAMIEKTTIYTMRCDGCGCRIECSDNEPVVSTDRLSLHALAEMSEWRQIRGRWYCPNCYGVDDSDNYVPLRTLCCFPSVPKTNAL